MTFSTLYKKTSSGAIQYWIIEVNANQINTRYGQVNGAEQQTIDVIHNGKNAGKKNETTPSQQAEAEALAKWEKQKKKGYVESMEAAHTGELDALIEGGILPMLAHTFEKQGHKIKYPCYVQPKLDGIRCIAILKNGKCTLWSRTRKPIASCPHIIKEIEDSFKAGDITLDGELYNSDFKNNFEHIVHLVRQEEPDPQHTDIQFHWYDVVNGKPFKERQQIIASSSLFHHHQFKYIVPVLSSRVEAESDVADFFEMFTRQGFEGAMLRNSAGLYVNKRSNDLIKVKEFQDEEFEICGIEEGRGKLAHHVGAFQCKTKSGETFFAKMAGETQRLRDYFENHKLWEGKFLTVKFQDYTSYGIPRFPVGLRIRIN